MKRKESDGDAIALGVPNALTSGGDLTYFAWISAINTISIKVCNPHGKSNSPLSYPEAFDPSEINQKLHKLK